MSHCSRSWQVRILGGFVGALPSHCFCAMKKAISKVRSTARGSAGEVGIHCSLLRRKLVLKQRPLARGTVGLLRVRRAMLGGEPMTPIVEGYKSQKTIAVGSDAVVTVICASKKIAAKKRPRSRKIYSRLLESIQIVTGPSLMSSTCMHAPN